MEKKPITSHTTKVPIWLPIHANRFLSYESLVYTSTQHEENCHTLLLTNNGSKK